MLHKFGVDGKWIFSPLVLLFFFGMNHARSFEELIECMLPAASTRQENQANGTCGSEARQLNEKLSSGFT